MRLKEKAQSAVRHYEKGGWPRVVETVSRYMPQRLFHLYRVDLLRLVRFDAAAVRRSCPYRFHEAAADDLDEIVNVLHTTAREEYRKLFKKFVADGQRCVVASKAGVIVGYYWSFRYTYRITDDGYQRRILTLLLPADGVMFGNGYIAEAHRLRGLFPHLVNAAIERLPANTQCFTTVDALNDGSLTSHRRLGFDPIATFSCRNLFGAVRWRVGHGGVWEALTGITPILKVDDLLKAAPSVCQPIVAGTSA